MYPVQDFLCAIVIQKQKVYLASWRVETGTEENDKTLRVTTVPSSGYLELHLTRIITTTK